MTGHPATASQRHRERRRCVRTGQPVPPWAQYRITPGRRHVPATDAPGARQAPPAATDAPDPDAPPRTNWDRIQAAGRHLDAAMLARPVYPSDSAKITSALRHHQIALSMAGGMLETSEALRILHTFVHAMFAGPMLAHVHPSRYGAFADGIAAAWERAGLDGPAPRLLCDACGRAPGGPGGTACGPSGPAASGPATGQGAPAATRQGGDLYAGQGAPAGDTRKNIASPKSTAQPSAVVANKGGLKKSAGAPENPSVGK